MIHPQDFALLFKATPAPYLILRPDAPHFTICEVNDAYCRATGSTREELLGKGVFDAFPQKLSDPSSNDLKSLKNSLLRVVAFRTEHRMNLQKHAVPFRGSKEFQEKYWSQVNYPVLDDHGSVMYIIHSVTDVTGQVPAGKKEKRIRLRPIENQEHYRSLFDHNPDTVYSFDLDGLFHHNALPMWVYDLKNYRFLEVNLAATEIYGYTREEFLQMTVLDIRPAEDAELIRTAATARTACRTQYKGYWRHVKKDKGLIYVDITSHLIEYNGIQASLILAQDVTQKILAEEASRKSEEVRTLIMNSALDAIACMDTRGMITLWNDQAEKIFGWKREELLGRRLSEYVIAEGCRATHDDGLKRYLEHGQGDFINQVVEVTGVDKKGIEFPIELTIVHIKQRESQFFCAYIRDITERKHHLTMLDRSEKRYKTLVQEGTDLIHIIDKKGNFQYVSPTYYSQLGYTEKDLTGRVGFDLIHEDDRRQVIKAFLRLKTEKRIKTRPYRYKDSSNGYRWLESVGTNLLSDPSINGILVNSKDITERMDYIRAVEEQNARLREIAWTQSHVIRAPLSRIMGIVNVLTHYPGVDGEKLLASLLSSAHELDEQVRHIVKSTEQIQSRNH